MNLLEPFKQLCTDLNVSPSTMAIAWTLNQGEHMLPIPGTRSRGHLMELASGSQFHLTKEISDQIDSVKDDIDDLTGSIRRDL